MSFDDVFVMVSSASEERAVLAAAKTLEATHDAQISALLFVKAEEPSPAVVYAGLWAVAAPIVTAESEGDEIAILRRRLRAFTRPASIKRIEVNEALGGRPGVEARRANLTIMLAPEAGPSEPFRRELFENVLFESGRPVLLVPRAWANETLGRTILVAWDGSREATRAVADAEPFFSKAERILFLSVDIGTTGGISAKDVVDRFRRRGLQCQHREVVSAGADIDVLLMREAAVMGADLMVMGGYHHTRFREALFGGVTRSLIRSSPVPLFISR